MAALELSYDMDWMTFRASAFYASGDKNPNDRTARGFDSIFDDPEFVGGQFSYWVRQGIEGGNALTLLKSGSSLLPNLRTDKAEGQANFVNPGVDILNVGYDAELMQQLTAKINLNYIRFDHTEVLTELLHQNRIGNAIGYDYSLGMIYRPWLNNQVIITGGVAGLSPTKDGGFYEDLRRAKRSLQEFLNVGPCGTNGRVRKPSKMGLVPVKGKRMSVVSKRPWLVLAVLLLSGGIALGLTGCKPEELGDAHPTTDEFYDPVLDFSPEPRMPVAPKSQTDEDVAKKTTGCITCHKGIENPSMHTSTAVKLGCTDCHGGNGQCTTKEQAHVHPRGHWYAQTSDYRQTRYRTRQSRTAQRPRRREESRRRCTCERSEGC